MAVDAKSFMIVAMQPPITETDFARVQRLARLCLIIGLVLFGIWIDLNFLPALLWAAILAVAIAPLYRRVELRWPRLRGGMVLPALFSLGVAAVVLAPIGLVLMQVANESGPLAAWLTEARAHGVPTPGWVQLLPVGRGEVQAWWQSNLATPEGTARELRQFDPSTLVAHSRLLGGALLHRIVIFLFTLIALFFVLKDHESIAAQMRVAGNRILGPTGERVLHQILLSVRGTINGLVLVGIGEGAVMTVVYWIAGVPQPLLLGSLTAAAAMIPFGAIVLFGFASVLAILQGTVVAAIAIFVIGLIVVGIADHFIRPAMIGGATRLPFIWVLVGILGGVESLGLLGLFVGPATMAALMMLWRDLVQPSIGLQSE